MSMSFGGANGNMPTQTLNAERDSSSVMRRRIIRDAVPRDYGKTSINGTGDVPYAMAAAPSRVWAGTDDYLARRNYSCGGPNVHPGIGMSQYSGMLRAAVSNCDATGVAAASCNPKFVADSSDFARYRALSSSIATFNQ